MNHRIFLSPVAPWLLGLVLTAFCDATPVLAREAWFRGLDLEPATTTADLVLVVRVAEVSDTKIVSGGKSERVTQQFHFQPLRTLKGIYTREMLLLTSDDLGVAGDDGSHLERGQLRVLFLGRSAQGYANFNQRSSLDQSLPPLQDEKDPFLAAVAGLIAVAQERDRLRRVQLLLEELRRAEGPSALPLLLALQKRALLAAQAPGTAEAVTRFLADSSPAVREAAARALQAVLDADYLTQRDLRANAVTALTASLKKGDAVIATRVAVVDALGATQNQEATTLLKLDQPRASLAEQAAVLRAIGRLGHAAQGKAVADLFERLPLDAPEELQWAAGGALARLDADRALRALQLRIKNKYASGLGLVTEISLLGELPAAIAAPALLDVFKLSLDPLEKIHVARICAKRPDPSLIPALATLLDPRQRDLRWQAVEALRKIDTREAAQMLRPHLREEADLVRKLQIAEFLGRHGIPDGYPYAMEHISEPHLLKPALAALVAIRDPRALPALRDILTTSHDRAWNAVAVRALGALGDKGMAAKFLEIVQDLKNPLAPAALMALGDLGEVKSLGKAREGLTSRNDHVVSASAYAAGKLIPLAVEKTDALRDQLATVLTDADAAVEVRGAALDALLSLKDSRLDKALVSVARDAGLEGRELLARVEQLLRRRKVSLNGSS